MRLRKSYIFAVAPAMLLALLAAACASTELPRANDTDLLKAVRRDDSEAFAKALSSTKDQINIADQQGRSPLMFAASEGRSAFVAQLIAAGAKTNATDAKGQTALHYATASGGDGAVKPLLEAGANPSAKDSHGWSPLTEAARLGNVAAVKALIKGGSKIDSCDSEGKTPLIHAASAARNAEEAAALLLAAGADPLHKDNEDLDSLMWSIKAGNSDATLVILEKTPSLSEERAFGLLIMQWAIKAGNIKIVEVLIAKGVPLNLETYDFTRITRALEMKGISKIFAHYDLIGENRTPLMWAALYGQPKIAALLIAKGSDVTARDNKGNTALDYAKDISTAKVIKGGGGA